MVSTPGANGIKPSPLVNETQQYGEKWSNVNLQNENLPKMVLLFSGWLFGSCPFLLVTGTPGK